MADIKPFGCGSFKTQKRNAELRRQRARKRGQPETESSIEDTVSHLVGCFREFGVTPNTLRCVTSKTVYLVTDDPQLCIRISDHRPTDWSLGKTKVDMSIHVRIRSALREAELLIRRTLGIAK